MRKIETTELKSIQLEILVEVDSFCMQNGIKYSLGGGTLLGAIRHKGYIPWDDDIDLMMPREDYDRFAATFRSATCELQDLRKDPNVIESFLKVNRKGTMMRDTVFGRNLWAIFIDIFPIDGLPNDWQDHYQKIKRLRDNLPIVCPFYKTVAGNKPLWYAKYIFKRISHPFIRNVLDIKNEIEDIARSAPFNSSPFAGVILGSYGEKEVVKKSVFDEYIELPFEGVKFPAIKDYDTYLSAIYGDYMTPPPVEKRVSHHLYDSYVDD